MAYFMAKHRRVVLFGGLLSSKSSNRLLSYNSQDSCFIAHHTQLKYNPQTHAQVCTQVDIINEFCKSNTNIGYAPANQFQEEHSTQLTLHSLVHYSVCSTASTCDLYSYPHIYCVHVWRLQYLKHEVYVLCVPYVSFNK